MQDRPLKTYDTIILGAGAAGLFCGAQAGLRGVSTLVLDHAKKPAEKVRISGGGRCNFTNIHTDPKTFLSANPHFAKSALARYTPTDFMDQLTRHGLTWHEKTLGQLFCDQKSTAIIQMLLHELEASGGSLKLETSITGISHQDGRFTVSTSSGTYSGKCLVVATGGLSIPKMGASGFAYEIAKQFGHTLVKPEPALVPFTFEGADKQDFSSISGVACSVRAKAGGGVFDEAMLFTHRGLSGPAMLQISSYWSAGEGITIDFFAGQDGVAYLKSLKQTHPMKALSSALDGFWPKRLVDLLSKRHLLPEIPRLADASHTVLAGTASKLGQWVVKPSGTEGWRTAEVTRGGVDTDTLSSKTMESRTVPGLYFIGECVDVTGWLGGYNFQWAWASGHAAAEGVANRIFA